jgi:hypothetical protein
MSPEPRNEFPVASAPWWMAPVFFPARVSMSYCGSAQA